MPSGIYDRTKSKPNSGEFRIGLPPWNKGKKGPYRKTTLRKMAENCRRNNPAWKGGSYRNGDGYIFIHSPNHPYKTQIGYVREHRLVVEKQIGRYLLPKEQVHHIGKRNDNRSNMLMAFRSDSAHKRFEHGIPIPQSDIIFDGRTIKEEQNV